MIMNAPIADSMANDAPFYSVPAADRFDSVCMYVCKAVQSYSVEREGVQLFPAPHSEQLDRFFSIIVRYK